MSLKHTTLLGKFRKRNTVKPGSHLQPGLPTVRSHHEVHATKGDMNVSVSDRVSPAKVRREAEFVHLVIVFVLMCC